MNPNPKMTNFTDQLEEIKTLLLSNTKSNRSFAYSSLLHLQEQSGNDPSLIQWLATLSPILLSSMINDISDNDEEIAAQALKCLGFLIYHSSLVGAIPGDDANLIVNSLAKVIITTKMKSICNLGVWCISVQQFNASILAVHFQSLLRAIVHALDNPIGSLSTTFEAIQAVMKLTTQISDSMRDTSNIWAPPIYRRLLSMDKKERDMSERCLLKIKSIILPPPLTLSKALVHDMKKLLLLRMKELLNQGKKIQAMQAWGWFIRILGPYALQNRHLINEMLKIPEQTFSDIDPQVQIASQVAWEGLIDALMHPPIQVPETNTAPKHGLQQVRTSKENNSGAENDGFPKSIKLIMTPLIGIMSSKCDASVHSSCLNTWCYLLYKLDTFVNSPSVIRTVWEPIFEAVFRVGSTNKSIWVWNFCVDLLDYFILATGTDMDTNTNNHLNGQLLGNSPIIGPQISGKLSWKHYPIKSMPWDLSQLDFYVKMVDILINQGSVRSVPTEIRTLVCDAALRIFKSVLKGIPNILKNPAIDYNEVMLCLDTILRFLKKIGEDMTSEGNGVNDSFQNTLQFVEAVTEELEPSILGSSLYKVTLDLKDLVKETRHAKELSVYTIAYMDMVSPIVYLTMLYFCEVFKLTSDAPKTEITLRRVRKYINFVLSSFDPLANLNAIICLLYKFMAFNSLKVWIEIANGLKDYMDGIEDFSPLKLESESFGSLAICHFLAYPFAVCAGPEKNLIIVETSGPGELSIVSSESQRQLELEHVAEVWKLLYVSVNHASRLESSTSNGIAQDLTLLLNGCLDQSASMHISNNNDHDLDLFSLYGNVVTCVLEHMLILGVSSGGSKEKADGDCKKSSGIDNILGFTARFMSLSWTKEKTTRLAGLAVTSRVFSALVQFVSRLYLKEDVLTFIQIMSSPLLDWLSFSEVSENTNHELQLLCAEILNCLQKSCPPIKFDSSFLKLQAPILERTLDHPNSSISDPTITFWNSTYGDQIELDYPQNLLHVLDKLSRTRRLNLERSHSKVEINAAQERYKVVAKLNRGSKRVELLEDKVKAFENNNNKLSSSKRKRAELTEHQKEVRRAQQGREMDCNGRGPGVRTYTSVDFSQGNDESQDSQEIRNSESILEMLRRAG